MPAPRPDRRSSRARRADSGSGGRRPRRRHGIGLWPITIVLSLTLIVLVAMLVTRDGDGQVATGAAEAGTVAAGPAEPRAASSAARDATPAAADGRTRRTARQPAAIRPTVANGLRCAPAPDRPSLVRRRAGGNSKRVALTFDDGPSRFTGPILDVLRRERVPATFFVLGAQIKPNRALMRRMVAEGHAVGNHTWSHADVSRGDAAANTQLMDTQYTIQQTVGRAGCLMRPPRGSVGPGLVSWLQKHRKVGVLWDVDSHDYQRPSAATMTSKVVAATRPGSIILLHDGGGDRSRTVAAVPAIIKRLKAKGYEFVTVPELLRLPAAKR